MWSDNESLSDYIDYSHLVGATTSIINNDDLLPCSIGIYGDWGGGKSSLMRMIEAEYEEQDDVLVIKFNGWLFEGYEDAKTVLMGRIVDEIISRRTLSEKALKFAAKLLKRIDWMKLAGSGMKYGLGFLTAGPIGVAGVSMTETLAKLKNVDYEDYVKKKQEKQEQNSDEVLRNNIQEFHQNFEKLIDETKISKIIVFIDDLDRCSPDTIIGTLEAIKLFLFTKKTAFVIGADERLIKYAVRRRFPEVPGDNIEVGRDYLEKLIQYPIRIPPLNSIELTTYINLLFAKLYNTPEVFETARVKIIATKHSKGYQFAFDNDSFSDFFTSNNSDFIDGISLCSQIVPVLSVGLNGNPRQTKRFLNAMLIRIKMAGSKEIVLKKAILAKLMLLEYFKPETFSSFHDIQSKNDGKLHLLTAIEKSLSDGSYEAKLADFSQEQKLLCEDSWILSWLKSEPKLSTENLQPYFYFSRDKLAVAAGNLQRMTPAAQEVFQKLTSESKSVIKGAYKQIALLSLAEATSVFEALVLKIRQEETVGGNDGSHLSNLFEVTREQPQLKSQLITFLDKFPEKRLPITVLTLSESILKDSHIDSYKKLMSKWSNSENKILSRVAKKKTE